jgi:hypothetical protein
MKIVSKNAASLFFPSTSLEFVYFEAVANSIDAGATEISIDVSIDSFNDSDTLVVTITDNGSGFDDKNFDKFNHVLAVEDEQHKGIGRLVYLNYFQSIHVESQFGTKLRRFVFNEEFDGASTIENRSDDKFVTQLTFRSYTKDKVKKYDYLIPESIKKSILEHFLPRFYQMKLDGKKLLLKLSLETKTPNADYGFATSRSSLDIANLPKLKEKNLPDETSLFSSFTMLYSVETVLDEQSVITAICTDGRTIPMNIISNKEFPFGYKMVFILYSDYFNGKTNTTRESFVLDDALLAKVRRIFTRLISQVIREEIPEVVKENSKTQEKLQTQYPHLVGYFDEDSIGLVDKTNIVNSAQEKFFGEQKQILEATELTDEQYELSLNFSSRILTEYVLYRTKILQKLRKINKDNSEDQIHDLIVPRKKTFQGKNSINDIFLNNAWVLDDKYMSYTKVMSDVQIEKIFRELKVEGSHEYEPKETGRPDLTLVFSNDPETTSLVDVVVIEFKKLGLKLAEKEEIYSQLKQRARRLLEFYPNKIQRIWFYGIIDFDREFKASLIESGYVKLFSTDDLFYKSQEIVVNMDSLEKKYADIFLLSYDAMLSDAEARNSTFLNILKSSIKSGRQ